METLYRTPINYLPRKKTLKSSKLVSIGNTLIWIVLTILLAMKYQYLPMISFSQYVVLLEGALEVVFVLNALSIMHEVGMLNGLTVKSRFANISLGFVLFVVTLSLLTWAACVQDVSILRFVVFAVFTVLWLVLSSSTTASPKKVALSTMHLIPEQKQPVCSVCQHASLYDVCLDCERKHQREIQRVRSQNWRAKKANEPATLTIAEWLQTLEYFHYHCAYCQTGPYECMEHYHPIGSNHTGGGTTAKNCVPGCYKCNTGKSNEQPEEDPLNLLPPSEGM